MPRWPLCKVKSCDIWKCCEKYCIIQNNSVEVAKSLPQNWLHHLIFHILSKKNHSDQKWIQECPPLRVQMFKCSWTKEMKCCWILYFEQSSKNCYKIETKNIHLLIQRSTFHCWRHIVKLGSLDFRRQFN